MEKLKVLHLFNHYLPIPSNWAYHLLKNLPEEVEVHIGARHYEKTNFYHPSFSFVENYLDGLMRRNGKLGKYHLWELIQKILLRTIPLVLEDELQIMTRYARDHNIAILHAHFGHVGWFFKKMRKELNIPLVVSFYGYDYEHLPFTRPKYVKRYKQLFQEADLFITEGIHGAKLLEDSGCPVHKIRTVRLGVELEQIPFFERKKLPGELHLVQVASFTEKKGQTYTVKAFAEALDTCPGLTLTLVGGAKDPRYKEAVLKEIRVLGLEGIVKVYDQIDFSTLHHFLSSFHVFIHPSCYTSQRDCEGGAPIVILDAAATGMPVISTRHCDIPSEVKHEETGLLADERDVSMLASYIKRFYQMDQKEYVSFARNGRKKISELFDCKENAGKLFELYRQELLDFKYFF